MTTEKNPTATTIHPAAFVKPMLIGAGIALALIALFLSGVDNPNPAWPKYWMVRPLIVVPLAGAAGGAFYAFMRPMREQGGWITALAYVLCIVVFIIGLWMGSVLGLDGTLWN